VAKMNFDSGRLICECTDCLKPDATPYPVVLFCPECATLHVDEGEWRTRPHKTHQCQNDECPVFVQTGRRFEWQPHSVNTVGVRR